MSKLHKLSHAPVCLGSWPFAGDTLALLRPSLASDREGLWYGSRCCCCCGAGVVLVCSWKPSERCGDTADAATGLFGEDEPRLLGDSVFTV